MVGTVCIEGEEVELGFDGGKKNFVRGGRATSLRKIWPIFRLKWPFFFNFLSVLLIKIASKKFSRGGGQRGES